ncbi:MAG: GGDEF domain-containing protein [Anaerolineales bacterium]
MFNIFRTGPRLHTDPELNALRVQLSKRAVIIVYVLFGIWLLADLFIRKFIPSSAPDSLLFDLVSATLLGIVAAIALRLIRLGNTSLAGYILANSFLVFALIILFFFTPGVFIPAAILFIPIALAGMIIGGRSPFFYSVPASMALAVSFLTQGSEFLLPGFELEGISAGIFLGCQIILHQGLATMFIITSAHVESTIEQLLHQTEQLSHLANTDALSGLANRRFFVEQLEREFARAKRYRRPLTLLYLDLDDFKSINDRFGHVVGDEVIRNLSLSMRAVLRSTDLLARIGGDEFAVLLPETAIKGGVGVTNKLKRALIAFTSRPDSVISSVTFSAGLAQYRFEDESIDDLLARADHAQYQAKDAGKGQIRTQQDSMQLTLFEEEQNP